jgi:hypothetical protein
VRAAEQVDRPTVLDLLAVLITRMTIDVDAEIG